MSRLVYLWIVMVAGVLSPPALAANPTVSLDVDVSALPEDEVTDALVAHIVTDGTQTLQAGGIEVVDGADTRLIVTVSRYGEHDIHYRTSVTLLEQGKPVERTVDCELCRDAELVEQIGKEIARLSGRVLYGDSDEQRGDDTPAEATKTNPEEISAAESDAELRPKLGVLGKVGIGTLAGGVASLGVGVTLALIPDRARVTAMAIEERTTRPTGFAFVGVGGALLMTGAVLVVVDVVRRKKQGRTSISPAVGPTGVALSIGVKF